MPGGAGNMCSTPSKAHQPQEADLLMQQQMMSLQALCEAHADTTQTERVGVDACILLTHSWLDLLSMHTQRMCLPGIRGSSSAVGMLLPHNNPCVEWHTSMARSWRREDRTLQQEVCCLVEAGQKWRWRLVRSERNAAAKTQASVPHQEIVQLLYLYESQQNLRSMSAKHSKKSKKRKRDLTETGPFQLQVHATTGDIKKLRKLLRHLEDADTNLFDAEGSTALHQVRPASTNALKVSQLCLKAYLPCRPAVMATQKQQSCC